jgi:hypothetical protein
MVNTGLNRSAEDLSLSPRGKFRELGREPPSDEQSHDKPYLFTRRRCAFFATAFVPDKFRPLIPSAVSTIRSLTDTTRSLPSITNSGLNCPIQGMHMSNDNSLSLPELDDRIAIIRDNIRQLIEQAAALSGAQDEERTSGRLAAQQDELDKLVKQRDALFKK